MAGVVAAVRGTVDPGTAVGLGIALGIAFGTALGTAPGITPAGAEAPAAGRSRTLPPGVLRLLLALPR